MKVPRKGSVDRLLERLAQPRPQIAATPLGAARPIRGEVGGAGEVLRGSGFSAVRTALGKYTITLDTELPSSGIMVTSSCSGGPVTPLVQGKSVFKVETMNPAMTSWVDMAFVFIIEPS